MALIKKDGKFVRYQGKIATDLNLCDCSCDEGGGTCCGRLLPGPTSSEGPGIYPLVLHGRITAGTCTYPAVPVDFDLSWNQSNLEWEALAVSLGGTPSQASLFVACQGDGFRGRIVWGVCACGGLAGACGFDFAGDESGDCDPLSISASPSMAGLMCCGNLGGGSLTIEVWE